MRKTRHRHKADQTPTPSATTATCELRNKNHFNLKYISFPLQGNSGFYWLYTHLRYFEGGYVVYSSKKKSAHFAIFLMEYDGSEHRFEGPPSKFLHRLLTDSTNRTTSRCPPYTVSKTGRHSRPQDTITMETISVPDPAC